ncbi:sulfatase-like hydrolase/transferase [Sphingomonas flavalba]|uniref:sulfatase-like hydrolase/transferase n=1 Tax=Sphingomonas flavalba TaxID=2559804 RepID=UPI001445A1D4|nr:sulfatase-like hydrolase/transferase [Sphingomonas flavalba]
MENLLRRSALLLTSALAFSASLPAFAVQAAPDRATPARTQAGARPNVIVILADDMGNRDVSSNGNPWIETSNIDSIGRDGVKFTSGYVSAPLCSPSRAGLVTGRYQQRFGFEYQVSTGAFPELSEVRMPDGSLAALQGDAEFVRRGVPTSERNIGELFKAAGYATGVVGKWHLGHGAQFTPQNRGFDYSNVFYGNTSIQYANLSDPDYISQKIDFHDESPLTAWTRGGLNGVRENGRLIHVDEYLLDHFRDRAIEFIERNKDRPFMLYLPMNAPVPPLQVPIGYFEALRKTVPNINARAYNALLLAQDQAVGAVLDKLKSTGLDKNTIVVFLSDNGGAMSRPANNAPYSGGKNSTYEGGIRVPFMIRWPGRIPAGSVYEQPVISLDILPTVAAAAGVSTKAALPLDGVNLLPYIETQNAGTPHEILFWKLVGESAVRMGKWKLWLNNATGESALYDLDADVAETRDLSDQFPQVKSDMQARYATWNATLPPPAWADLNQYPAPKAKAARTTRSGE